MECPPYPRYTVSETGRGPLYVLLIFCGGTQTQTKKTNSPFQTMGSAVKETQWARGTEGDGDWRLYPVEQSKMASLGR